MSLLKKMYTEIYRFKTDLISVIYFFKSFNIIDIKHEFQLSNLMIKCLYIYGKIITIISLVNIRHRISSFFFLWWEFLRFTLLATSAYKIEYY